MVFEAEKEVLQRFGQYIFRRETAEVRKDLHRSVVEMVLHLKDKPLDPKTIRNEIERQLGLNFDQSTVDTTIGELVHKDFIRQKNEAFYLTGSRRRLTDKTINARKKLLSDVEKTFISKCRTELKTSTPEQEKTALGYLYAFLSKLFSLESQLLLGVLRCSKEDVELVRQYKPPKEVLSDILAEFKDEKKLKKAIEKSIVAIFNKSETISFLNTIARNHLYFQILNLDPECRLLQKEIFSKKVLLLDTNVLMKLLLISASGHKAVIRCVSLSRELGVQLKFTKSTKEEFLSQLRHSNERFRELKLTRLDTLASLDDDFIASYALEKQKTPKLTWTDYFYKYRAFETILSKWGITKYKGVLAPFEVFESGLRGAVDGFVLTCARELTGFIKPKKVTEHDSYHLLLVRKLREDKPSDTLGPLFWFLTFDASLLCVDKGINQILETEYELPSSIECWAWVELISPYFGAKISKEAGFESFSDLMKTQFSLLPVRIDTQKLVTVQTREINYDLFTPEQIRAILNDEFVKEYWSKFQEAKKTKSPIVKKYQKEMQERVEVVAEKILTKRTQTEIITRYISAGMSLLTIAFALYCTYTEKYIGTVILGILAVTFIAIAVGYSRLELIFEKARAKLSLKKE